MNTIFRLAGLAIVALFALPIGKLYASPQILGLLASAKPIPLTCIDGVCAAEFSTYCLQSNRKAPNPGVRYKIAQNSVVKLAFTDAAGFTKVIPARDHVAIESVRGFSAVRITVAEDFIKTLGRGSFKIKVEPMASLVPVRTGTEAHPLTKAEIIAFTRTLRFRAETLARAEGHATGIARTANRLINGLRDDRPAEIGDGRRLWQKMIGGTPEDADQAARKYVARELDYCEKMTFESRANSGYALGFRSCLESMHDEFMSDVAKKVWDGLKAGG